VSKPLNPGKKTVELRPSRIRRDPPPAAPTEKAVRPYPTEREVWIVAIGVILFALAISALMVGISDITSH
jgi:hypothetical protein